MKTKKNQTTVKPLYMKATVSGINCSNEAFTEDLTFTLLPPDTPDHYGTGYYMVVKTPSQEHLIDVRYERTTDISVLADRWIQGWYGKNAREVKKEL